MMGLYAGLSGMGLSSIAMSAAVGELLALIAGNLLLFRYHKISVALPSLFFTVLLVGTIGVCAVIPGILAFILVIDGMLILFGLIAWPALRTNQRLNSGI